MSPLPNQAHASQISTDPDLWHKRLGRRAFRLAAKSNMDLDTVTH